jgi:hypothetical protein
VDRDFEDWSATIILPGVLIAVEIERPRSPAKKPYGVTEVSLDLILE